MEAKILIAALTATTCMTLFSYLVSWIFGQPFKEPLLLAVLLNNLHFADSKANRILGWILHYLLGLVFVLGFEILSNAGWAGANAATTLAYGAFIGIIGIAGWKLMFRLSGKKPSMDYTGYYVQLFVAHLVFALAMAATFKVL